MRDDGDLVAIGRVVGAHGLRGQIKILPLTSNRDRFEEIRSVNLELQDRMIRSYDVEKVRIQGDLCVVKLTGVDDRSSAETLRGAWVSVTRAEIPPLGEGSFYVFDLEGLEVFRSDGVRIGTVVRVEEFPANDVLVVESETEEIWIPALKDIIREVNIGERRMMVALPEGLPTYPKHGS